MTGPDVLAALLAGDSLTGRHVLVTAHPDDETISASRVLSLAHDATIFLLTDGTLRDGVMLQTVAQRHAEFDAALVAGHWSPRVWRMNLMGREAHAHASLLVNVLEHLHPDVVWTHPYEGGDLDHDTAAWLVQTACDRLGAAAPLRMEFASYHLGADRADVFGSFWPVPLPQTVVRLTGAALARKQAAMAAYVSQASILRKFKRPDIEPYRLAPRYDFTKPSAPTWCRWDVKGYQPSTTEWRAAMAELSARLQVSA